MASNDNILMNNEFERMWNEAAMAYFKLLYWHLRGNEKITIIRRISGFWA
jgi:hypothetical protein